MNKTHTKTELVLQVVREIDGTFIGMSPPRSNTGGRYIKWELVHLLEHLQREVMESLRAPENR